MALGKIATRNLLQYTTLGGTAGSAALPMANLLLNALATSPRHIGRPMRQTNIADLAANVIELAFDKPRSIDLIGVLFHTMGQGGMYRVTVAGVGGTLATPIYQSPWIRVHPRRHSSMSLRWRDSNFWGGQALVSDLDVFSRNLFITLDPSLIASAVRIELDDRGNAAGFYDVGGLWISSSVTFRRNFDRGRRLGLQARDKVEETPSGRRLGERRRPRRVLNVDWTGLTYDEAYRLYDDCARVGTTGMVIFIPDADDVIGSAREAFAATIPRLIEPQFTFEHQHRVSMTLEEIIA